MVIWTGWYFGYIFKVGFVDGSDVEYDKEVKEDSKILM